MSNIITYTHPFKQGVMAIIANHFATEVASRFNLVLESETYNKDASPHIWRQVRDNNLVMEVYYNTGKGNEYVCDLFSWESKKNTEHQLLKCITEKVKQGKFGEDWVEHADGRISKEVKKGGELVSNTNQAKH